MYPYELHSEHKYIACITIDIDAHMEDAVDELKLMCKFWPSITFEVDSSGISIIGKDQHVVECATEQFLSAVKRHDWWPRK